MMNQTFLTNFFKKYCQQGAILVTGILFDFHYYDLLELSPYSFRRVQGACEGLGTKRI